jgi:hypothetical protein
MLRSVALTRASTKPALVRAIGRDKPVSFPRKNHERESARNAAKIIPLARNEARLPLLRTWNRWREGWREILILSFRHYRSDSGFASARIYLSADVMQMRWLLFKPRRVR